MEDAPLSTYTPHIPVVPASSQRVDQKKSTQRVTEDSPNPETVDKIKKESGPVLKRDLVRVESPSEHKLYGRQLSSQDLQGQEKTTNELGTMTLIGKDIEEAEEAESSDEFVASEDEEAFDSSKEDSTSSEMEASTTGESSSLESPPSEKELTPRTIPKRGHSREMSEPLPSRPRMTPQRRTLTDNVITATKRLQLSKASSEKMEKELEAIHKNLERSANALITGMLTPETPQDTINSLLKDYENAARDLNEFQAHYSKLHPEFKTTELNNKLDEAYSLVSQTLLSKIKNAAVKFRYSSMEFVNLLREVENHIKGSKNLNLDENLKNKLSKTEIKNKLEEIKNQINDLENAIKTLNIENERVNKELSEVKILATTVNACSSMILHSPMQKKFLEIVNEIEITNKHTEDLFNKLSENEINSLKKHITSTITKIDAFNDEFKQLSRLENNPLLTDPEYAALKKQLLLLKDSPINKISLTAKSIKQKIEDNPNTMQKQIDKLLNSKEVKKLSSTRFESLDALLLELSAKQKNLQNEIKNIENQLNEIEQEYLSNGTQKIIAENLKTKEKELLNIEKDRINTLNKLPEFNTQLYVSSTISQGITDEKYLETRRSDILHKPESRIYDYVAPIDLTDTALENIQKRLEQFS